MMGEHELNDLRTRLVCAAMHTPRSSLWMKPDGSICCVIDHIFRESDMTVLVVYAGDDGISFACPAEEFNNRQFAQKMKGAGK